MQRELKKRDPFAMTEEEVALNLARTSDQVQIRFSRLFCEHELTPSQYNILRILRGEGKPLPILEIADRMVVIMPGITGLIDRLEAKGMVGRERSVEDRRIVYVAITERGLALLADLDEPIREPAPDAHRPPHPRRAGGADPTAGEGPPAPRHREGPSLTFSFWVLC